MMLFCSAHEDVALAVPAKTSPQATGFWRLWLHLAEDGQRYNTWPGTANATAETANATLANATLLGFDFVEGAGGVGD